MAELQKQRYKAERTRTHCLRPRWHILQYFDPALSDTFQDDLLSPPIYTRPEIYKGLSVPKVLLSGNDKEIQKWNDEKSLERTRLLRPNLFDND